MLWFEFSPWAPCAMGTDLIDSGSSMASTGDSGLSTLRSTRYVADLLWEMISSSLRVPER